MQAFIFKEIVMERLNELRDKVDIIDKQMAKLFADIIMKEWRKDHKSEIAEQRYEDSVKSF